MNQDREFWEKYHKENDVTKYSYPKVIKSIASQLDIKYVLEIGCGYGKNLESFVGGGLNVVGIDISELAIQKAKQDYPKFRFYVGSILEIPLTEKFDLVITAGVTQHIPEDLRKKAFDEMHRVSNKYILNIEAYDKTEHEINWHRGKGKFWTIHMAKRWQKYPVKILDDYSLNKEYRLTLVSKI